MVTPSHKIILLTLPSCNFAIVRNHSVTIWCAALNWVENHCFIALPSAVAGEGRVDLEYLQSPFPDNCHDRTHWKLSGKVPFTSMPSFDQYIISQWQSPMTQVPMTKSQQGHKAQIFLFRCVLTSEPSDIGRKGLCMRGAVCILRKASLYFFFLEHYEGPFCRTWSKDTSINCGNAGGRQFIHGGPWQTVAESLLLEPLWLIT